VSFDYGDPVALRAEVRAAPVAPATVGDLANATAVTCTVTLPDGTTSSPSVTNASTGVYTISYAPTMAGRHVVRWTATGTNAAEFDDVFIVKARSATPLVSLADFKTHLNITSTTNDEELRRMLLSASDLAERVTGRIFRLTTFTEAHDGGTSAIRLRRLPVVSLTTVTESGSTITSSGYTLDANAGVLYRGSSTAPMEWTAGQRNVSVTYVAGEGDPPQTAYDLVLELGRHMWRTQRGAMPSAMGSGDDYVPGAAYALTYRARELVDALRMPGLA